ncbi:TOBE domain-containing protein [Rhizobium sp. TRM95796]|nr:TOBE domain-containing protein [Rhizobium sp. TRM95796]MCV3767877.1 TOBE domain-containing protein [Rhizobium sp. TRM95796]
METAVGRLVLPRDALTSGEPVAGQNATVVIRPEHFRGEGQGPSVDLGEALVEDAAFFGTHQRCHLRSTRSADTVLVAHLPQSAEPKRGDRLMLAAPAETIVVLPAE